MLRTMHFVAFVTDLGLAPYAVPYLGSFDEFVMF